MVQAQMEEYHPLQTDTSIINWKGTYSFKFSEHVGTVKFSNGTLITAHGNITGGTFQIDMTSITNEDHARSGDGPVNHLKDPDFFDVAKFPKAQLTINKVTYFADSDDHKMEADLTIKGITKPVEFWLSMVDVEKKLIKTKFKIDRTRWGITYNNKLKDHAISEAIEFDVALQF
ncbi:MAG: hypothetical protein Aureis2KO_11330 [Aureisphaera sp.]